MTTRKDIDSSLLVWEREVPPGRPGAAAIAPAEVATAAMAIADREGLNAVSVKRVASKLGVPLTRLESYLPHREDLLDLMLDGAFAEIGVPERDPSVDWRTDLRTIAHSIQAAALRHPWLRSLAGTRTPCGPAGLRNSERVLESVDGLGLDAATTTHTVNTMLAFVYGFVQLEMGSIGAGDPDRRAHTAQYLMQAMAGGEYPVLARVFSDATVTTHDAFEVGLEFVLDGIALQIDAVSGSPTSGSATEGSAEPSSTENVSEQNNAADGPEPSTAGTAVGPERPVRRSRRRS